MIIMCKLPILLLVRIEKARQHVCWQDELNMVKSSNLTNNIIVFRFCSLRMCSSMNKFISSKYYRTRTLLTNLGNSSIILDHKPHNYNSNISTTLLYVYVSYEELSQLRTWNNNGLEWPIAKMSKFVVLLCGHQAEVGVSFRLEG